MNPPNDPKKPAETAPPAEAPPKKAKIEPPPLQTGTHYKAPDPPRSE